MIEEKNPNQDNPQAIDINLPNLSEIEVINSSSDEDYQATLTLEDLQQTEVDTTTASHNTHNTSEVPVIEPDQIAGIDQITTEEDMEEIITPKKAKTKRRTTSSSSSAYILSSSKVATRKTNIQLTSSISVSKSLQKKLAEVTLLILDVDGVLTDGTIYVTDQGFQLKAFYSHDGHGLKMLLNNGIDIMLLSARQCKATRKRARELGIDKVNLAISDKKLFVTRYMKTHKISSESIAYIGDDFIDLPAMLECGVKIMPANGIADMGKAMDYVTKATGGRGAVRELCDMILVAKNLYQQYLDIGS